jgi:hypothetical protein
MTVVVKIEAQVWMHLRFVGIKANAQVLSQDHSIQASLRCLTAGIWKSR